MENTIPKYHRCNFCANKNTGFGFSGFCVPSHVVGRKNYEGYMFHCRYGDRFMLDGDKALAYAKKLGISIGELLTLIEACSPKKPIEEKPKKVEYRPWRTELDDAL